MQKLFRKSLELARACYPIDFGDRRCYHISCLFNKNRLLAVGENKIGTHPRNRFNLRDFDISLKSQCSELNLFIRAKNKFENINWKKVVIINVRLDRNGKICNSCPCSSCKSLISYLGAKNIYYSTNFGTFEKFEIV